MSGNRRHCHTRGARGFSLVELLIAVTICALISASIAAVVPPARVAFEATPAEIDLQQRGRAAVDAISNALRTAGGDAIASSEFGPLNTIVPAVILSDADGASGFTRLKVMTHRANAAQGVLAFNTAPGGPLMLMGERCPAASVVCGFVRDATALISDGSGGFELFTVAAADVATNHVVARQPLSRTYPAGSFVIEVEAHTFQLEAQPDGSHSLMRITANGAVQPLVDRVSGLWFEPYAMESGTIAAMPVERLTDGPWSRGEPDDDYDDDAMGVRRVDVTLTLLATRPAAAERTFRFAVFLRNVP